MTPSEDPEKERHLRGRLSQARGDSGILQTVVVNRRNIPSSMLHVPD
ncbi:MAG: hypothetical protein ACP5DY_07315 [Thermovirgaceae bacterium]